MTNLLTVEDRILVLKDRVDTARKNFDPNQPRDKDGQWSRIASGVGMSRPVTAVREVARAAGGSAKVARDWFRSTRIRQHLPNNLTGTAKDVAAAAISALVTQYNQSNIDEEAVRNALRHLRVGLKLTHDQAREVLRSSLTSLRRARLAETKDDDTSKAKPKPKPKKDPVVDVLDKAIEILDKQSVKKGLVDLEDRVLVLRDRVDVLKTKHKD